MVSASAKARHTISRRLGVCKAEAEPRKPFARFFCAAVFIGYAGNASRTFYFYTRFSSAYAGNASRTFYFYTRFSSAYADNVSLTFIFMLYFSAGMLVTLV